MTQVKIQFCLLGTIFTTKFAKIKDREIAPFEHWFEFCRLFNKRFRECKQTLSVLDKSEFAGHVIHMIKQIQQKFFDL